MKRIRKVIVSLVVVAQIIMMFSITRSYAAEDLNLNFAVISDTHYFPTRFNGTRSTDYQNQISGDMRMMGEGEALSTAAVDQILAQDEKPEVLFITGDLSSEGEKASHEGLAK